MRRFFRRAAHGGRRVGLALAVALLAGLTSVAASIPSAPSASALSTTGYWLVGTDGGIFSYGRSGFFGSTGSIPLNQPIAGMAATPDGRGYWMVASDGGIFAFGNAAFYGSMGGKPLNQPIVAMAATRTGRGYWLVASDGGIFSFGDAPFFGSMGSARLNKPIVDIVPTPSGRGYWMAASDGGIFSFGDAGFFGSTGSLKLAKRIQQMAATPSGRGYWMVAGDGGVFAFGDAAFYGAAADGKSDKRIVDIAPSGTGKGYYMTGSNGAVFAFGDAKYFGGAEAQKLTHGIISMVALNGGDPPLAGDDALSIDEDTAGTVDVLVNDVDPEGGSLTVQSVSTPAHGTASFAIGTVGYRPSPNFHGNDSFTYTVVDSQGNTALGLVNVTVRSVDDLPRVVNDTVSVPIGGPTTIDVLANDTIGDGLGSLSIVGSPSIGSAALSVDGHSIVYSPSKKGNDTLRYRVVDTDGDNAEGTVTIKVTGADLVPNAVDVSLSCGAGTCSSDVVHAPGVNLGDNGQVTMVGEKNGSLTVDGVGTFTRQGGVISFAAVKGSVGDAPVDYQIVDDNNGTPPNQTVKAKLTFQYQNGTPTADSGSDSITANTPKDYQLVAHDPDGDPLTFWYDGTDGAGVDATSLASIEPNGALHFSGAPGGVWTVKFHVTDPSGAQVSGTYTITTN
jgi:hypothetical protein